MKLKSRLFFKLFAVATILCPMFALAENLQSADALLQKYAPVPEVKVAQPEIKKEVVGYTVQDIVKMLPIYVDHRGKYGRLNSDYYDRDRFINTVPNVPTPEEMLFVAERVEAFNQANFGSCDRYYLHLSQLEKNFDIMRSRDWLAEYAFRSYLETLFNGKSNPDEWNVSATLDLLKSLQNPETFAGRSECSEHEKYFVQFKEILDAVTQAAPAIVEQNKRIAQAIRDTKIKEYEDVAAKSVAREKTRNACLNSNQYKLYYFSQIIAGNLTQIAWAQQAIEREKAGAKISGYVNKQIMYEKGNQIASLKASNEEKFKYYRAAGGTAKKIDGVIAASVNPCAEL